MKKCWAGKIIDSGNPPLTPGTAIATFDKDGKYTNKSNGVSAERLAR